MDTFNVKKNNPYKDLSEKKLISKSKDGDTKAFDELINRHDKFINSCINSFLKGDAKEAKKQLGWKPKVKFKDLVRIMCESDKKRSLKGRILQ